MFQRHFNITRMCFVACLAMCFSAAYAQKLPYSIESVNQSGLVAKLYLPESKGPVPAVIAFGGSEGGLQFGDANGQMIAPHGIAVLSLAYFNAEGLPNSLDQIPLEYFLEAIDFLSTHAKVDPARIGVVSGSRGSEAALLIASNDMRIRSVVVTTPSSVVWGGAKTTQSAWTLKGRDIAFLKLNGPNNGAQLERLRTALADEKNVSAARIPIDLINGPIFFISAKNDQIWPSYAMSMAMEEYLSRSNFKFSVSHASYLTGHGFSKETAPEIKQSIIDFLRRTLAQ